MGTPKQRADALASEADVYVINRENFSWLVNTVPAWPFDMVVIDEGGLGAGIVDRLKEQRYKIKGVNFGNKSVNPIDIVIHKTGCSFKEAIIRLT